MKIDFLYFEDCPSWQAGMENLKAALAAEEMVADIRLVKVATNDDAARLKFLGSPSFCVDGMDWWPEERDHYRLSCRVYPTPQGMKGSPTVEMLREKLHTLKT
jgi:hypothetical protein